MYHQPQNSLFHSMITPDIYDILLLLFLSFCLFLRIPSEHSTFLCEKNDSLNFDYIYSANTKADYLFSFITCRNTLKIRQIFIHAIYFLYQVQ